MTGRASRDLALVQERLVSLPSIRFLPPTLPSMHVSMTRPLITLVAIYMKLPCISKALAPVFLLPTSSGKLSGPRALCEGVLWVMLAIL